MKKTVRKINNRFGFTLAETLLAILILLMVSLVVATGIPAARDAYEKVVLASNAEILLSTAMTEMRNELGTARDVDIPGASLSGGKKSGTEISYHDSNTGLQSRISLGADGSVTTIQIKKGSADIRRFLSETVSTRDLYVSYSGIDYYPDTGIVTINNLSVKRTLNSSILASRGSLSIRVMSDD